MASCWGLRWCSNLTRVYPLQAPTSPLRTATKILSGTTMMLVVTSFQTLLLAMTKKAWSKTRFFAVRGRARARRRTFCGRRLYIHHGR